MGFVPKLYQSGTKHEKPRKASPRKGLRRFWHFSKIDTEGNSANPLCQRDFFEACNATTLQCNAITLQDMEVF
jgi:hypothetical protein